jgi:hypothetical protein
MGAVLPVKLRAFKIGNYVVVNKNKVNVVTAEFNCVWPNKKSCCHFDSFGLDISHAVKYKLTSLQVTFNETQNETLCKTL